MTETRREEFERISKELVGRSWVGYLVGAVLVLVLVLVAAFLIQTSRLRREQSAHAKAALATVNAIAERDTTRLVFRDSLTRIVERLIVQRPQGSDAVDRELKQQRIALAALTSKIDRLSITAASSGGVTSDPADNVRHAAFDVRKVPYTAHADVDVPRTGSATIKLDVAIDSIPIEIRPGCSKPDAHGIRSATLGVVSPPWAPLRITRAEQDAGLCRSPAIERADRSDGRLRLSVVMGYGYTFGVPIVARTGSPAEWRAFLGLAVAKPISLPRWLPLH